MKLTSEQLNQARQAKASGEQRVFISFTGEQCQSWQELVERELSSKTENADHIRKIKEASAQPGFFGDIRRAILLSRRPIAELSKAIGVDSRTLSAFRAGDAELPAAALDRLVSTLGLRLMQEIPQ